MTNAVPLVSIIVPCWNRERFLPETVASVAAQAFPRCELIIVNDGSTDASERVAREMAASYPSLGITVIDQPNRGVAEARNTGIRQARGEWILALDSDDRLAPGWLRTLEQAIREHPGHTAVAGMFRAFGLRESDWIMPRYAPERLPLFCNLANCTAYRKWLWKAAGGYDPNLPQSEDWHFWIKCREHGLSLLVLPEPMLEYRIHDAGNLTGAADAGGTAVRAMLVTLLPDLYEPQSLLDAHQELRGMNDRALAAVREKIAVLPHLPMPRLWLALALEGRGDILGAREAFLDVLKLTRDATWENSRQQAEDCLARLDSLSGSRT